MTIPESQSHETLYERAEHAARFLRSRADLDVRVALVLGSGLGAFAGELEDATPVAYDEIPGFARPTVEGHAGRLVLGRVGGVAVAAMQGRFHFYEGYTLEEVTFSSATTST
jgi:purine-nucleoside phosphorylase